MVSKPEREGGGDVLTSHGSPRSNARLNTTGTDAQADAAAAAINEAIAEGRFDDIGLIRGIFGLDRPAAAGSPAGSVSEFCSFDRTTEAADREVIHAAYVVLNAFRGTFEAWWRANQVWTLWGGESGGEAYLRHLDGTVRPKVVLVEEFIVPLAQAHSWADGLGAGVIEFREDYLRCLRDVFGDATETDPRRWCALLEVASTLAHETMHVVGNFSEAKAWSIGGYFRSEAQRRLGIATESGCGQVSWPCGTRFATLGERECSAAQLKLDTRSFADENGGRCR